MRSLSLCVSTEVPINLPVDQTAALCGSCLRCEATWEKAGDLWKRNSLAAKSWGAIYAGNIIQLRNKQEGFLVDPPRPSPLFQVSSYTWVSSFCSLMTKPGAVVLGLFLLCQRVQRAVIRNGENIITCARGEITHLANKGQCLLASFLFSLQLFSLWGWNKGTFYRNTKWVRANRSNLSCWRRED